MACFEQVVGYAHVFSNNLKPSVCSFFICHTPLFSGAKIGIISESSKKMHKKNSEAVRLRRYRWGRRNLFVHILCVAGIDYSDDVTINGISIVPFVGIGHIKAVPSANGRLTAWQCPLYSIDIEDGIAYIALHVFKRIGMSVFQGNIPVKSPDIL